MTFREHCLVYQKACSRRIKFLSSCTVFGVRRNSTFLYSFQQVGTSRKSEEQCLLAHCSTVRTLPISNDTEASTTVVGLYKLQFFQFSLCNRSVRMKIAFPTMGRITKPKRSSDLRLISLPTMLFEERTFPERYFSQETCMVHTFSFSPTREFISLKTDMRSTGCISERCRVCFARYWNFK